MGIQVNMESIPEDQVSQPATIQLGQGATENSQTASDYIDQQLALEADAKEILPYKFDKCTYDLGPLRQSVFACLTCSPPPASEAQVYTPAGVCYSCSISCHGEHNLVEIFHRRNFVCDCGTTRVPSTSTCILRSKSDGTKGVNSQEPGAGNTYNHNFQNHFCGCDEEYDADTEKGTMYQCLGLGTVESGGCGEDWWHPHCLMGLPKDWNSSGTIKARLPQKNEDGELEEDEHPVPEGFPHDDNFASVICYKCVESNPWIKPYAGTTGFLPPLTKHQSTSQVQSAKPTLKRKASIEDTRTDRSSSPVKRVKEETAHKQESPSTLLGATNTKQMDATAATETASLVITDAATTNLPTTSSLANSSATTIPQHKHTFLPTAPPGQFALLLQKDFRDHLCHCPQCFPNLIPHPQLVEEEDDYEPSLSSSSHSLINGHTGGAASGTRSHGTASLLDRGEAALSTMDRVKAIEGVMVYNHLRDKVKEFLKPYAESGQAVGAEDIKQYFEKLRGDQQAVREAAEKPVVRSRDGSRDDDAQDGSGAGSDARRSQSGY